MSTAILETIETTIVPEPEGPYEIIDGKPVEKLMGVREVHLRNVLSFSIGRFAFDRQLGLVESEMLFDFEEDGQSQRRPDVAFISYAR